MNRKKAIPTERTKDSELLAVMIYRSFVVPEALPKPPDATFITFRDALDLYARTVMREAVEDRKAFEAFKETIQH